MTTDGASGFVGVSAVVISSGSSAGSPSNAATSCSLLCSVYGRCSEVCETSETEVLMVVEFVLFDSAWWCLYRLVRGYESVRRENTLSVSHVTSCGCRCVRGIWTLL